MGSYLNHVAAKALEQPIALQPRVPSLFEPPPALRSARLGPLPFLKVEPETRLDSGDSGPPHDWSPRGRIRNWETRVATGGDQESGSERQTRDADRTKGSRIMGHKARQTAPAEPAALSVSKAESTPSAVESVARTKPRIVPADGPGREPARSDAAEPPKLAETGIAPQRPKLSPTEPRPESTRRKQPPDGDSEFPVFVRHEQRSVAADARAEVPTYSQPPTPKPLAFPRTEPNDAQEKDGGFSVSVVIGRVNVQAVLSQPAPARLAHPAPAPLLSLEQYLKQRGGHS
jgi:hypothetical protein